MKDSVGLAIALTSDIVRVLSFWGVLLAQVKTPYDVMSVASWVSPAGELSWFFRFYDVKKEKVVDKVRVSGDGKRIMK